MSGGEKTYQVWHPTKPEASFPDDYRRVVTVEANGLSDAARMGDGQIAEGTIVVDPALIVHCYEGNAEFGAFPLFRDYERFPALREITGPEDRAFAAAVFGTDSPTPEQIDRIISNQQAAYREDQDDRKFSDKAMVDAAEAHYAALDEGG